MAIFLYCGLWLLLWQRGQEVTQRKLEFCFLQTGSGEMHHSRQGVEGDSSESQWTKAVLTKAWHCTNGSKMAPGWTTEWTLCEDGVGGGLCFVLETIETISWPLIGAQRLNEWTCEWIDTSMYKYFNVCWEKYYHSCDMMGCLDSFISVFILGLDNLLWNSTHKWTLSRCQLLLMSELAKIRKGMLE